MPRQNAAPIFKIEDASAWAAAEAAGTYAGAPVDHADGFIHLSAADQVAETLRRHFAGRTGLVLVAVDPSVLGDALKWEPSRGGALFPHLYGPLPMAAVLGSLPIGDGGILPAAPHWGL